MAPMPSILQSMSWSPSHRRMFLTLVPTLTTRDEPLTFRSLMTVTVSPSCSTLPAESLMTLASSSPACAAASADHSWAHSGQTSIWPSSKVYSEFHLGHGGNVLTAFSHRESV